MPSGRQLAVVMAPADEVAMLAALGGKAVVELFESFAPSREDLVAQSFSVALESHWHYWIWNRAFPWTPEFAQVDDRSHDAARKGWWYVKNSSDAPLLEFTRSDPKSGRAGRLYWAKDFAAPNGLAYDVAKFASWVDGIWRWVRRTGRRCDLGRGSQAYVLPGALTETGRDA